MDVVREQGLTLVSDPSVQVTKDEIDPHRRSVAEMISVGQVVMMGPCDISRQYRE